MLKRALLDEGMTDGIEVVPFCGLLVEFCKERGQAALSRDCAPRRTSSTSCSRPTSTHATWRPT